MIERKVPPPSPQAQASDPGSSAWVSANAGSGKTTVLVWRVIRLLLNGVPPSRILCLTYTKAAAAHMANKVLETLSRWVRLEDAELDAAMAEIVPGRPSAERRARARELFAAALETPGGLKVQTIHAFCDRVLHMFPVEAEAPAGFKVLEELGERDMIENARLQVLLDAGRNPHSSLGMAFAHCMEVAGDDVIERVIGEAVQMRRSLRKFDPDKERAAIMTSLGLKPHETLKSISREILEDGALPQSEWESAARALLPLSGNATKAGEKLADAARSEGDNAIDIFLSVFFTEKSEPRKNSGFGAEKSLATIPELRDRLFQERDRLYPFLNKLRAARECERSCALLLIASEVIARYEEAKRRRGVLDFSDLVTKTVTLLEREESAWVHFKLDGGIEHILVDEAQDTSPEQWRIIKKLAEEFFAGEGASDGGRRTIFAVGDEKQSIFSFQGADPVRFDEMRVEFAAEISAAGQVLNEPRLRRSYRSTAVVLGAVDKVFDIEDARKGLSAHDTKGPLHEAVRQSAPGMVEIWPELAAIKSTSEEDGWDRPLDRPRESSAQMQLARQIAKAAKYWIEGGLTVGDRNREDERQRAVTAGDIIVLVQSRGPLFDAILRALKREGVPVAGADRLRLTENIAVMDLIALGDALLLAEDELSLACVLKSPLFGFDDEDLLALCHGRSGTLMHQLANAADEKFIHAASLLARWRELALHLRPFDFYSRVLGCDGGRKKMIARLGPEAADALDEFIAAALSYESSETPSLHGFLSMLRRADAEVKRDFEATATSVRVMTVHGVKGLEAPVVVLADTTTLPAPQKEPQLVAMENKETLSIWAGTRKERSSALQAARDAARELRLQEYRRLLYVALTRAADVLVVCGALNRKLDAAEAGSWYDLVRSALCSDAENISKHKVPYFDEEVQRWRASAYPLSAVPYETKRQEQEIAPDWLVQRIGVDTNTPTRMRPSHLPRALSRNTAPGGAGRKERGVLLHRLLQSLPELRPEERMPAALRYLLHSAPTLTESAHKEIVEEALRVIAHPDCAAIFGPNSRAEPELIALIRDGGLSFEIPARLDRLVVTAKTIVFADFKSDADVPSSVAEIPEHYISQLAVYRAALVQAFPGRELRALLIFTARPRAFEVPAESLDSAWLRVKTHMSPAFA